MLSDSLRRILALAPSPPAHLSLQKQQWLAHHDHKGSQKMQRRQLDNNTGARQHRHSAQHRPAREDDSTARESFYAASVTREGSENEMTAEQATMLMLQKVRR